ncbi:MAG: hypothetical protein GY737_12210 [Desulfobacteraceae bacterium]|nr:hypothetical protein [Desulfobacteraceae bacterium]
MTNNIERTKAAMLSISQSLGLPEHYPDDMTQDLQSLSDSKEGNWLWLLRTSGTVLVPLQVGIHPTYVNYWLHSNHGQKVVCFVVDSRKGMVTQTTFSEAEKLIGQSPRSLHSTMSAEELVDAVHSVLAHGCERRLWGMFESPESIDAYGTWQKWQAYFRSMENDVMAEFMAKAVRFAQSKQTLIGHVS